MTEHHWCMSALPRIEEFLQHSEEQDFAGNADTLDVLDDLARLLPTAGQIGDVVGRCTQFSYIDFYRYTSTSYAPTTASLSVSSVDSQPLHRAG